MNEPDTGQARRILAAGLSPAWQQILIFDEFKPGEVNRAREVHWGASGKVLNVGIALAQLTPFGDTDCRARVLSVISPRARAAFEPEFSELGVDCRWIECATETRTCTTILDLRNGRTTELVENAAPLMPDEVSRFRQAFVEEAARADVVLLTGSLPHMAVSATADSDPKLAATHPQDRFYRELIATTRARAILDIRGPELLAALECRPYCVKPNREELGSTLGRDLATDDGVHAAMRELNDRGAQWVVITHGSDTVWASHQGKLYRFQPPRLETIVNPIGSGDCLAAGIAWATAAGRDMLNAIRFGVAAAVDNVGQLLPARINAKRIAALEPRVGML